MNTDAIFVLVASVEIAATNAFRHTTPQLKTPLTNDTIPLNTSHISHAHPPKTANTIAIAAKTPQQVTQESQRLAQRRFRQSMFTPSAVP